MEAGFSQKDVLHSVAEIMEAGFSQQDVLHCGFSADLLKRAGYLARDLYHAGYFDGYCYDYMQDCIRDYDYFDFVSSFEKQFRESMILEDYLEKQWRAAFEEDVEEDFSAEAVDSEDFEEDFSAEAVDSDRLKEKRAAERHRKISYLT